MTALYCCTFVKKESNEQLLKTMQIFKLQKINQKHNTMSTIIEIEKPKIKEQEKLIYNPTVKKLPAHDAIFKIMRIELEEDYTRIDFVYNNVKYDWVQIEANSFIRPVGTKTCYTLVKAQGIPYAPKKYNFKSANETLYYTLYFPALPKNVKEIDIIEKELPHGNYFNFYGVSMERVRKELITI